mmetsp:Transcript_10885/g.32816  ORF Transcript_10885/g.32816 Transcript_10885/m.32816 type:complete len:201 (+) Transcript_10885:276-878(+)
MPLKALVTFPRVRAPLLASRKAVTSATFTASICRFSEAGCPSAVASNLCRLRDGAGAAAVSSPPGKVTMRSGSPSLWPIGKCGANWAFFKPLNCRVNLPSDTEPPLAAMNAWTSARRAASRCSTAATSPPCSVPGTVSWTPAPPVGMMVALAQIPPPAVAAAPLRPLLEAFLGGGMVSAPPMRPCTCTIGPCWLSVITSK